MRGSWLLPSLLGLLLTLALLAQATELQSQNLVHSRRRPADDDLVLRVQAARDRNSDLAAARDARQSERQTRFGRTQARLDKQLRLMTEAARSSVQRTNAKKLAWMQEQAARSSSNVISATGDQFKKFVFEGPRPYHVFLTLTALSPQHRCLMCRTYHEQFALLASSYRQTVQGNPEQQADVPVFFVELDVDNDSREVFEAFNLRQVPTLLLVKSKSTPDTGARKLSQFLKKLPARYRFQAMKQDIEASDLGGFLFKNTNLHVNVDQPINQVQLAFVALLLVSLPYLFFRFYHQILMLREQLTLIVLGAGLFYGFCISGSMYNFIRGTPFSRYEEGGMTYIARANRDQYGAESWIVSFLVLTATGCMLLLSVLSGPSAAWLPANSILAPKRSAASSGVGVVGNESRGKTGLDYLRQPVIYVVIFMLVWFEYLSIYTTKNPYYRMGMVA